MAFMALPSDQATMSKHFKGTSASTGVSSLSQATYSTSLVSDFKDKFSVEGPSSLYTITNGNSPGIQRASSSSPWSSQEYQLQNSEPNSRRCGTQSPELLQTSDWLHMDTSNMHFVNPGVTVIPTGSTVSHGSPSSTQDSTARMHEILGRLGSNHPCHPSNGAPPPGSSPHAASPQRLSSGPLRNNSWSTMDISNKITASLDTAKGISLQGAGLATSHCLAQFTSDPGFAERAAKFSSFSNGSYSQLSPPYLPEGKGRRSGAQSVDNDGKLSRSSSSSRLSHLGSSNGSNGGAQNVETKSPEEIRITEGTEMEHDARDSETHMKTNDQKGNDRLENCSSMEGVEGAADGRAGSNELDTGDEHENSSCSEQPRGDGGAHGGPVRSDSLGKRKNSPKEKSLKENSPTPGGKLRDNEEANAKRCRSSESVQGDLKGKGDRCSSENSGETSPRSTKECLKPPEAPKQDFIHVRARRGQATDSHSLAERVRREKISERMKFLQDLVPGCSKVTGKAVMLDEIINYVQSLQRQVEFLSMKLAAVNPRLDFNVVDNILAKEMQTQLSPPAMMVGPDLSNPYGHHQAPRQAPMQQLGGPSGLDFRPLEEATEASLRRTMSAPVTAPLSCLEVFGEALSQTSSLWDGELESVVNHMSFLQQSLPTGFLPQGLHCQLPAGHMKVEL